MVALRVAARGSSTDSAQWELQTARSVLQLDRSAPWELQLLRTRNDRFAQWELQLLHTHAQDTAGSPSGSSTWDASPPAQSPSGMPDGSWWAGDGPLPYAACYWYRLTAATRVRRTLTLICSARRTHGSYARAPVDLAATSPDSSSCSSRIQPERSDAYDSVPAFVSLI